MNYRHLLLSSLFAVGLCGALKSPAQAQPDPNEAPKTTNPPNWNWNPGGRGGNRGQMMRMPLTADQLKQLQARQTEMRTLNIRQQLTASGFTDEAMQTAVVDYYKAQNDAQATLSEQWQKISQAVQAKTTPDTQLTTMLSDFRAAVDKEKLRRAAAYTALDTQIGISKKPLLDALLMTMGITGDEATVVGQTGFGGMDAGGLLNIARAMGGFGGVGGMGGFQMVPGAPANNAVMF